MSEPAFPLAGIAGPGRARLVGGEAGLTLAERQPGSYCEVALWPPVTGQAGARIADLAGVAEVPRLGRLVLGEKTLAFCLVPGRFNVIAAEPGWARRLEQAVPPETGAVVDLSQGRGGIRIAGPHAQYVLQKGLDLDLDPRAFPPLAAAQSVVDHMPVTVLRLEAELFDLFTFRGFALSFWELLSEAASEAGWRAATPVP
jgi:methylglutamate dehydrogenase subunit D